MPEYIDREAAVRAIDVPNVYHGIIAPLQEILCDIPAADVVERPRWISVEERLPEKRKWVLCRCEANIIEVLRWENNEWYHDPMHVYYPSFVTHWMPLPEPPEEGEP